MEARGFLSKGNTHRTSQNSCTRVTDGNYDSINAHYVDHSADSQASHGRPPRTWSLGAAAGPAFYRSGRRLRTGTSRLGSAAAHADHALVVFAADTTRELAGHGCDCGTHIRRALDSAHRYGWAGIPVLRVPDRPDVERAIPGIVASRSSNRRLICAAGSASETGARYSNDFAGRRSVWAYLYGSGGLLHRNWATRHARIRIVDRELDLLRQPDSLCSIAHSRCTCRHVYRKV